MPNLASLQHTRFWTAGRLPLLESERVAARLIHHTHPAATSYDTSMQCKARARARAFILCNLHGYEPANRSVNRYITLGLSLSPSVILIIKSGMRVVCGCVVCVSLSAFLDFLFFVLSNMCLSLLIGFFKIRIRFFHRDS